MTAALQVGIS